VSFTEAHAIGKRELSTAELMFVMAPFRASAIIPHIHPIQMEASIGIEEYR
jgi:hypothetical protein